MRTQVAIVGGGPGGTSAALHLARHGVETVIIERAGFPRYHIGESLTGECGAVLRGLGLEPQMLAAGHPQKQGVRVYGKRPWWVPVMMRTEAGELQDQYTWQVRRSDFDKMLLDEAVARGSHLVAGQAEGVLRGDDGSVRGLKVAMLDGGTQTITSDLVLDASGQRTFLAHQGVTGTRHPGRYAKQIAVFSQVANTIRDTGVREENGDNTLIFYASTHRWGWFIPLDAEVVSVGVVVNAQEFAERRESKQDFLQRELRELHPELARRVPDPTLLEEARAIPNYSYSVDQFTGRGFACIGDAHRFIDPIFSFGAYFSMKESQLIVPHVLRYLTGETRGAANPFAEHQAACSGAQDRVEALIDAFWGDPLPFAMLVNGARTRADLIDMFAGRVYTTEENEGVRSLRQILARGRAGSDPPRQPVLPSRARRAGIAD